MAFNYSPKVITEGLVLYLDAANVKSYVSGSTVWNDLSRNRNTGTLTNGPTFNSGNGGSIVFDGVDDYVLTTAAPPTLGMISGSFTVCCWFYCNNLSTTNGGLVNSRTAESAGNSYEMLVRSNNLIVGFYGEDQPIPISNNTWYYAVHTYNYTTKTSKVYLNSSLQNTKTRTTNLSSTGVIKIGTYSNIIRSFNGNINIVQIYNRELSSTEITQNYNALKGRYGL
jgi:hypothetical protein